MVLNWMSFAFQKQCRIYGFNLVEFRLKLIGEKSWRSDWFCLCATGFIVEDVGGS